MGIIEAGISAIIDAIEAQHAAAIVSDIERQVVELAKLDAYLANVMDSSFATADRTFGASRTEASRAGKQIEDIGWDLRFISQRLIYTIIPQSLSWLEGDIILHIIDPIRAEIKKIRGWLGQLFAYDKANTQWRNKYVDPNIRDWIGFHKFFNGWPLSTITTVRDWLQHPAHFATFAVPIVARPLVDYYAAAPRKPLRDYLALTMVDAWSEEPNRIWQQILQWVVTDG